MLPGSVPTPSFLLPILIRAEIGIEALTVTKVEDVEARINHQQTEKDITSILNNKSTWQSVVQWGARAWNGTLVTHQAKTSPDLTDKWNQVTDLEKATENLTKLREVARLQVILEPYRCI